MLRNDSKSVQLGNCLSEIYNVYKFSKNLPIASDASKLSELKSSIANLTERCGNLFELLSSSGENTAESSFLKSNNDVSLFFKPRLV